MAAKMNCPGNLVRARRVRGPVARGLHLSVVAARADSPPPSHADGRDQRHLVLLAATFEPWSALAWFCKSGRSVVAAVLSDETAAERSAA
jgi:hypothetical protein